jgi:HD-GYP domain-containing protein (c-di-GMP phosphodiesterase class II)
MAGPVCHFCGTAIAGAVCAHESDRYCCEGCYLREREFRALRDAAQQAAQTLAEALVAALDVREHETGLHSKRVACHTLVLARRFTSDDEQLRQVYWGARLFAVVDALDAITTDRPYRRALSFEAARGEILAGGGRQFDPEAVAAFVAEEAVLRDMVALKCGAAPLPAALAEVR